LALVLTATGAAIQDRLSGRWIDPDDVRFARDTLHDIPRTLGPWRMTQEQVIDERTTRLLQLQAAIHRTYIHRATGRSVSMALLYGPSGPLGVHDPEICYSSQAYELQGRRDRVSIRVGGHVQEFWGLAMRSLDDHQGGLRVVFGWRSGKCWEAANLPRVELAQRGHVFKLQVSASTSAAQPAANDDPCVDFIHYLLADFEPRWRSKSRISRPGLFQSVAVPQ
jgi:hypothetical protein